MNDLFGDVLPTAPFKDIANQRPSVAEEKATLCATLNRLLQTPPRAIGSGSVNRVRAWRAEHKRCLAILKATGSSRTELRSAIETMQGFDR